MLTTMPSIRSKSFDDPDESRHFPLMDSELAQIGSIGVGRATLQPGWRWTTPIGPLIGDPLCQVHHVSLVLSGRIGFETEDGESGEFGPNTLVDVAPGHD